MIATDSNKMTARYLALAFDGDGTLTFNKKLSHETAQALDRLLACNRKLILVSGQTVAQVTKFPGLERFELVVAENGAVLYWPASRKQKVLASSPPPALAERLRKLGIDPLTTGEVIVATRKPHDEVLRRVLKEMNLDWRIIYNLEEAMALPSEIDKSTGLCAGLEVLGLTPVQVIGIGNAQNDIALLQCCGLGVALSNAVPALREHADLVMAGEKGHCVVELVDRLLADDLPLPRTLVPGARG